MSSRKFAPIAVCGLIALSSIAGGSADGISYMTGQIAPVDMVSDIWGVLKTAGPFVAVIGYLWFDERSERKRIQGERDALHERTLNALNMSTQAMAQSNAQSESIKALLPMLLDLTKRLAGRE